MRSGSCLSPPGLGSGDCHSAGNSWPRSSKAAKLASALPATLTRPCPPLSPGTCAQAAVTVGRKEGPPSSGLLSGLPGLGEARAGSGPGPGPGTGESAPRVRWLIKVPRTDGRQCQQNGFWAAGWRIPPLSDLCCVLRGREPGPLPKLRCFRSLPSSGAHSSAFLHSPVCPPRASPRHCVLGEEVRAAAPLPRGLVHCLGTTGGRVQRALSWV